MNIIKANQDYEAWLLRRPLVLIQADLDYKYQRMSESLFEFLRATFFRWVQLFAKNCPDLNKAPEVLAIGDLHTENFGSWRDREGRLVWGINDFDEAFPMSYAIDLVRLTVSAAIALGEDQEIADMAEIAEPILEGYRHGLRVRGEPFVLAEDHEWLLELIEENLKGPEKFWDKLEGLPTVTEPPPDEVQEGIRKTLPPNTEVTFHPRVAGLGSLGLLRIVGLADYCRAKVAREAKLLKLSAVLWARGKEEGELYYKAILRGAVRCPDPFLRVHKSWIVRRLSPDYTRVLPESVTETNYRDRLLHAMGFETANVHLATKEHVKEVRQDLKERDGSWLRKAAEDMLEVTIDDWNDWVDANPAGESADFEDDEEE